MKTRENRIREKARKSLFSSESAGATVIAAVLLLCIIFSVFAVIRIEHVPEWKTDAEESHMKEVESNMAELKSTVDLITLLTSDPYSSAYGFSVTVPFSLGGGEIPVFEPSKSSGTLSVNTEPCNITINTRTSTGSAQVLGNQILECGGINYHSNNNQYMDQTLRYENGAVILSQSNRSLMKQFPSFNIAKNQNNESNYTFSAQLINISGDSDSISSDTSASLRFTGLNNTPVYDSTDSGGINSFNFTIITKYPDAWYSYFNEVTEDAGLDHEDYKLFKNNTSDNGLYSVYFEFPAGDKSLERFYISKSVIQAELGAGSNFKDTSRVIDSGIVKKLPVAGFGFNPQRGCAPVEIQITDKSQYATKYIYDFGDGTPVSTEKAPKHTYTKSGTFTITQTVTNSYGTDSTFSTINVLRAYAYITNYNSNTVSVIDTANKTVIVTVDVGNNPSGIAVSPDGTRVYLANQGAIGTVSIIDTINNTVTATVNVGNSPWGVAVNSAGTKVYVAHQGGSNDVYIIYTANNTVQTRVKVGSNPTGLATTPDGTKLYVTNSGRINNPGKTVSVIDTATNTVTTTVSVGSFPFGVAVTPDGTKVYVTNAGSNTVSVIDTATNTVTETVNVGYYPEGVAVTSDGTKVYVTNYDSNTISVIDTSTNAVISTVNVGSSPTGVAINKEGTKVYVANSGDNTVSVIDTTDNNSVTTVNVGENPIAFGQFIVLPPA